MVHSLEKSIQFRKITTQSYKIRYTLNNYTTNYEKLDVYTMLIAYCLENNYTQSQKMQYKNVHSLKITIATKTRNHSLQNNYTKL